MPHSLQACSAPSKQMPGSNPKGDRSSIASISASSTISIPSYEPSVSKPRDFNLKREQNPRYRQHNGLTAGIGNAVTELIVSIAKREVTFFSGTAQISFL